MRKFLILLLCFSLCLLPSCAAEKENSDTRILMNTVVTITARCSQDTISQAFELCSELENKLSRTVEGSDIWEINNSDSFASVGNEALFLVDKSLQYSRLSNGRFDITVCPVSGLYDFSSETLPTAEDISAALSKVDYRKIQIDGNKVALTDGSIDLGGIAKGYVADRVVQFLKEKGVSEGIVNIGGNVYCFGKEATVGIKKPFSNELIATVKGKEGTFVTSGIYERYIEKDGRIYHHIIDPATGYGVENDLAGVTVIGNSSADADALSTVCMLLGSSEGISVIEDIPDTEAVFVKRDGTVLLTDGLYMKDGVIRFK